MKSVLIKNASIVNEGKIVEGDVLISGDRIEKVGTSISHPSASVIEAAGKYLFPGVIDDQVHFREPGLMHKGDIHSESRAAVAGGITTFMEMPNTVPNTLTQSLLEDKYNLASSKSLANYSFFMGASNDNMDKVLKTNPKNVCGVKIFMGSSTGNMLVDNERTLENIFSQSPMLIAVHCEDEATIRRNMEKFRLQFGEDVPMQFHPVIRSAEACYKSSSLAVSLAKKFNSRLHILHISTAKELELFSNGIPLKEKRITAEACIHHLWFDDSDYAKLGSKIKWNPAIKTKQDKDAILAAVLNNVIDVIATDHAPHTSEEKNQSYFKAPSGGPLVQHSLVAMLEFYHRKKITLEKIAEKMSHAVADCFRIAERGFIREGYFADLVLADLNSPWTVSKSNLLYKCGWSPFESTTFNSKVTHTFVSGHLAYIDGKFDESQQGKRISFDR
ncbi:dihydroorotase [soil metagenome]